PLQPCSPCSSLMKGSQPPPGSSGAPLVRHLKKWRSSGRERLPPSSGRLRGLLRVYFWKTASSPHLLIGISNQTTRDRTRGREISITLCGRKKCQKNFPPKTKKGGEQAPLLKVYK